MLNLQLQGHRRDPATIAPVFVPEFAHLSRRLEPHVPDGRLLVRELRDNRAVAGGNCGLPVMFRVLGRKEGGMALAQSHRASVLEGCQDRRCGRRISTAELALKPALT
jgi:hypothetical protein